MVYQWCSEGDLDFAGSQFATSGYMAISREENTILLVLRGTRSFKDTLVDLNSEMVAYGCEGCKVHKGFYMSHLRTWEKLRDYVLYYTTLYPEYSVKVMGHSLGGAISVLMGLRIKLTTLASVQVITMGQPMVGNPPFADHVNAVLQADSPENSSLLRVTHRSDPVVKLPISDNYNIITGDMFMHSASEIFINETLLNYSPNLENVVSCSGNEDMRCSAGMPFTRDNRQHLNYFRKMGNCGFGFI